MKNFRANSVFHGKRKVAQKSWIVKNIFNTVKNFRANSVFQGKRKSLNNPERWKIFQYSEFNVSLQDVSGPIRIKLKKLVSGQIFSAPSVKCLPVRLWSYYTYIWKQSRTSIVLKSLIMFPVRLVLRNKIFSGRPITLIHAAYPQYGYFCTRFARITGKYAFLHLVLKITRRLIMGVGRGGKGAETTLDIHNFSKKGYFLSFEWEKTNFTTFGLPLEKTLEESTIGPGKNPCDAHEPNYFSVVDSRRENIWEVENEKEMSFRSDHHRKEQLRRLRLVVETTILVKNYKQKKYDQSWKRQLIR